MMIVATLAISASFVSCASGEDAVADEVQNVVDGVDGIMVAPFPALTIDNTRTVEGNVNNKKEWEEGDKIFVRINGEYNWRTLLYSDGKWAFAKGDEVSLNKNDTYEAVYAPNYEINKMVSCELSKIDPSKSDEYLTCSGKRPIYISFQRNYSRLRVHVGENVKKVGVWFGEGFTQNSINDMPSDGYIADVDNDGNAYFYGAWKEGTNIKIKSMVSGSSLFNYVGGYIYKNITSPSVDNRSYAIDADVKSGDEWIYFDSDCEFDYYYNSYLSDFINGGYTKVKIVGVTESTLLVNFPILSDGDECRRSITDIDMSEAIGLKEIDSGFCSANTGVKNVILPKHLTKISGFAGCTGLVSVTLPEDLTEIGNSSFSGCESLSSIVFPSGLTKIGSAAFRGCNSLTALVLPESLTELESFAFYGCENLNTVTLPSSLNALSSGLFDGCSSLKTVICKCPTAPTIGVCAFSNTPDEKELYVISEEAAYEYRGSHDWTEAFGMRIYVLPTE